MDTLACSLESVMSGYAGHDLNGESFLTRSDDGSILTVISIGDLPGQHFAVTSLAARVTDGRIVIDADINDKPLVDALVAAGVPRDKIVLAYAGEPTAHAA